MLDITQRQGMADIIAAIDLRNARWNATDLANLEPQRRTFGPANEIIVGDTFHRYVASDGMILELGCGFGELIRLCPSEYHRRMVATDVSAAAVVETAKRYPQIPVLQASALKLPFADSSAASVVAFALLDLMSDLDRAMGEISRVLRPGGSLVHFHDFSLDYRQMIDAYVARGMVPVPYFEDTWFAGFEAVPRANLRQALKSSKQNASRRALLKLWLSDPFGVARVSEDETLILSAVREIIASLNLPHEPPVSFRDFFAQNLQTVMARHGMVLEVNAEATAESYVDASIAIPQIESANVMARSAEGMLVELYDPETAAAEPDCTLVLSALYVIVARKIDA